MNDDDFELIEDLRDLYLEIKNDSIWTFIPSDEESSLTAQYETPGEYYQITIKQGACSFDKDAKCIGPSWDIDIVLSCWGLEFDLELFIKNTEWSGSFSPSFVCFFHDEPNERRIHIRAHDWRFKLAAFESWIKACRLSLTDTLYKSPAATEYRLKNKQVSKIGMTLPEMEEALDSMDTASLEFPLVPKIYKEQLINDLSEEADDQGCLSLDKLTRLGYMNDDVKKLLEYLIGSHSFLIVDATGEFNKSLQHAIIKERKYFKFHIGNQPLALDENYSFISQSSLSGNDFSEMMRMNETIIDFISAEDVFPVIENQKSKFQSYVGYCADSLEDMTERILEDSRISNPSVSEFIVNVMLSGTFNIFVELNIASDQLPMITRVSELELDENGRITFHDIVNYNESNDGGPEYVFTGRIPSGLKQTLKHYPESCIWKDLSYMFPKKDSDESV